MPIGVRAGEDRAHCVRRAIPQPMRPHQPADDQRQFFDAAALSQQTFLRNDVIADAYRWKVSHSTHALALKV